MIFLIFIDLTIEINGTQIESTFGLYWLQSYMMLLLSMSTAALGKWEIAGYYEDELLQQTDPDPGMNIFTLINHRLRTFLK